MPTASDTTNAVTSALSGRPITATALLTALTSIIGYTAYVQSQIPVPPAPIRVALTTSGYAIPSSTQVVRFTQTGTIASSTITLPPSPIENQPIELDNYAGQITAASFSPAMAGWTNGLTFAAPSTVKARWDATDATWHRTQ